MQLNDLPSKQVPDFHPVFLYVFFQEIDGDALLLLKSEMMMKYLGLKLGPALKLCYHIDRLKQNRS